MMPQEVRRGQEGAEMEWIAMRWCLSERLFRNLPKGILWKFLRGPSQFPLSSSGNSRRLPAHSATRFAI